MPSTILPFFDFGPILYGDFGLFFWKMRLGPNFVVVVDKVVSDLPQELKFQRIGKKSPLGLHNGH